MKTKKLKNLILAIPVAVIGMAVFPGCNKDDDDVDNKTMYTVSGTSNGTQVVPSVTATGTGNITGTYDANTNMLTYTSTWAGLSGAPTSAAFYSGASGTNGTLIGNNWTLGSGLTGTGTFSSTMTLSDAQETQLINNGWYYSYGTATNPNGEIRGQITTTLQ
jgi:hypothetical protein